MTNSQVSVFTHSTFSWWICIPLIRQPITANINITVSTAHLCLSLHLPDFLCLDLSLLHYYCCCFLHGRHVPPLSLPKSISP